MGRNHQDIGGEGGDFKGGDKVPLPAALGCRCVPWSPTAGQRCCTLMCRAGVTLG